MEFLKAEFSVGTIYLEVTWLVCTWYDYEGGVAANAGGKRLRK